jgi:hypothetical protein
MPILATIAAATALASTAFTTGKSFSLASKQRKIQREAESDAAKAMAEARKKLEVNFYDNLSILKEPYEREREAIISAAGAATTAAQEGDTRGAAATAGRIQLGVQQGQREIAGAMGQEMLALQKLSADEASRLRDMKVGIDLGEVEGAQLKARDAQESAAAYTQQGMQGIQDFGEKAYKMAPLFDSKSLKGFQSEIGNLSFTPEEFTKFGNVAERGGLGPQLEGPFTNLDFQTVGKFDRIQFENFLKALTRQQKDMLSRNLLNPFNPY